MNRTTYIERAERRNAFEGYKTLEQQIWELWASRGMKVVLEKFECLKDGRMRWTIYAKQWHSPKEKNEIMKAVLPLLERKAKGTA